jgi:hypothetical protein
MHALQAEAFSIDALKWSRNRYRNRGEVLSSFAASLNYRDLAVLPRTSPNWRRRTCRCHGAGSWLRGRRRYLSQSAIVTPIFTQGWHDGPHPEQRMGARWARLDGVLQEYIAVPAEDAVLALESSAMRKRQRCRSRRSPHGPRSSRAA